MKSIEQIDTENDTKSLISSFMKLIGLPKLTKKVNFKRQSGVSLTMIISWAAFASFCQIFFVSGKGLNCLFSQVLW